MTSYDDTTLPVHRRTILRSAAAGAAIGLIGVPAFSGSALGIQQEDCPDDVVLLATENNHPAVGDTVMDARIYAIYPAVGQNVLLETHTLPVDGTQSNQSGPVTDNFNGNAWDDATSRFYFSRYDRLGPAGGNPLPSELYFTELAGDDTAVHAGTLTKSSAGAAFSDGDYYYIAQRTNELRRVTFNANGTVDADTVVATIGDPGDTFGFGDITFDDDVIYASATRISDFTVLFFSVNSDGTGYTEIATGSLYGAGGTQISFGKDGVLYGVNARSPQEVFSIDTATGDTTFIDELPVAFSDVSNGPLCTECVECDTTDLLAKYEFACVETVDDECVDHDFVLETGSSGVVGYAGEDYTVKDGDESEPMTVTFTNDGDYCALYAVVKAGTDSTVVAFEDLGADESFTVDAPDRFAISNVRFYCDEAAAEAAAAAGPGGGPGAAGRGRGR